MFSRKLREEAENMTVNLIGHATKNLMQVTSDTAPASPTALCRIRTFSGVKAPLAVLRTDDASAVLVCAADSMLAGIQLGYENFTTVWESSRRKPPKFCFTPIPDPAAAANNPNVAKSMLAAIQREVLRLEAVECTWKPRRYFAMRLRELEKQMHAKCVTLEGDGAPPTFPDNPYAQRPNKRVRTDQIAGTAQDIHMPDAPPAPTNTHVVSEDAGSTPNSPIHDPNDQ